MHLLFIYLILHSSILPTMASLSFSLLSSLLPNHSSFLLSTSQQFSLLQILLPFCPSPVIILLSLPPHSFHPFPFASSTSFPTLHQGFLRKDSGWFFLLCTRTCLYSVHVELVVPSLSDLIQRTLQNGVPYI